MSSLFQAKEEVEALEKKMQQLENELVQTQTNLETATHNLEEKEKALQNVGECMPAETQCCISSESSFFFSFLVVAKQGMRCDWLCSFTSPSWSKKWAA